MWLVYAREMSILYSKTYQSSFFPYKIYALNIKALFIKKCHLWGFFDCCFVLFFGLVLFWKEIEVYWIHRKEAVYRTAEERLSAPCFLNNTYSSNSTFRTWYSWKSPNIKKNNSCLCLLTLQLSSRLPQTDFLGKKPIFSLWSHIICLIISDATYFISWTKSLPVCLGILFEHVMCCLLPFSSIYKTFKYIRNINLFVVLYMVITSPAFIRSSI